MAARTVSIPLLQHRTTPHTTTQVPSSELLFNRVIRGSLPTLNKNKFVNRHDEALENEAKKQACNKQYADKRRNAKWSEIEVGDHVLVQQHKKNKLSARFNKTPYVVTNRHRSQIAARNKDMIIVSQEMCHILKRSQTFWKLRPMTTMTIDNHNNNTDDYNNNKKDKDQDHHYVDQLDCVVSQ